ncbi:hypothetical protein ACSRUE_16605 [Sorangium sp. KYC3313]|uniref:hypothetical protein n=1 Tax=Sorangium sp. KYC3313 TaxID=3449740 RepID=UPI003F8C3913
MSAGRSVALALSLLRRVLRVTASSSISTPWLASSPLTQACASAVTSTFRKPVRPRRKVTHRGAHASPCPSASLSTCDGFAAPHRKVRALAADGGRAPGGPPSAASGRPPGRRGLAPVQRRAAGVCERRAAASDFVTRAAR